MKTKHIKIDISNVIKELSTGQEFKSYYDLCANLKINPTTGNAKKSQMKEINRFMLLEKEGNKFIIKEIYDKPKPKEEKPNARNSKYKQIIEYLITQQLYNLAKDNKDGKADIACWFNGITYNLSMVNENFTPCNSYITPPDLKKWLENNEISEESYQSFYYSVKHRLREYIETALRSLQKHYQLGYSKEFLLRRSDGSLRFLMKDEAIWYREEINIIIKSFNIHSGFGPDTKTMERYDTLRDVIINGRIKEFFNILSDKIHERFGEDTKIYETYRISTSKRLMEYARQRVSKYKELVDQSIILNDTICEGLKASKTLTNPCKLTAEQRDALVERTILIKTEDFQHHVKSLLVGIDTKDASELDDITEVDGMAYLDFLASRGLNIENGITIEDLL